MLKIGPQLGARIVQNFAKSVLTKVNLTPVNYNLQLVRNTSFFNKLTQAQLWKGVTSVSNAGRRRGRGRLGDARGKRNLNAGQKIGSGKIGIRWPGLNYSVMGSHGISKIQKLPESEIREPAPVPAAVKLSYSKKIHPLERGWSGIQTKGKYIGPPEPIDDATFEDFKSVVLEFKQRTVMTSTFGRKRTFFVIVATGNGNGLLGVGVAKGVDVKTCLNLAKKRASKRLLTIDLIDKNMINHDFFSEYGRTRISVLKKPEGYGLRCHRVITALCKLIGIENMHAKVEGAINVIHIIRAFITGLRRQKTYQEIADDAKLHLVEFKEETLNYPQVLASPQQCLTSTEAKKKSVLFEEYIMGGKLVYDRSHKVPFYMKLPSWGTYLKRNLFHRNHNKVRIELLAKYGECRSHLTNVYPECKK